MNENEVARQLSKLTVIVLTKERPQYLQYVVRYWSQWPVTLMILDGSSRPTTASHLPLGVARLTCFASEEMSTRMEYAAANIETPFACLHSDDDFTLARGAAEAITWLGGHESIGCVTSDVMWFGVERSGYIQKGRSVTADSSAARLKDHFSDYRFSYFYGIQRSQNLSTALRAVADATTCPEFLAYPNLAAGFELGVEICGAALGGLFNSPDVLLLKSFGDVSLNPDTQGSNEWLEDPSAQSAVRAWRLILSQHLATNLNLSVTEVDDAVDEALMAFCIRANQKQDPEGENRRRLQKSIYRVFNRFRSHRRMYASIRFTYRLVMRLIGRPRPNPLHIFKLDRCDAPDIQDVIRTLDESGR